MKMAEMTIDAFKNTLDTLISSNAHARNKGDDFKDWCKEHFCCDARISHVKEQLQITNRVSEQFSDYWRYIGWFWQQHLLF